MGVGGGEIAASRIVSCGGAAFAGYSSAFAVTTPCRNVPSSLPRGHRDGDGAATARVGGRTGDNTGEGRQYLGII